MNGDHKIIAFALVLTIIITFLLYFQIFNYGPLGLDAVGHLSKVKIMQRFGPFIRWNSLWYVGIPFLKFYPPTFYYIVYTLSFLGIDLSSKIICLSSIFLTALGIFLYVKRHSEKNYTPFFAMLLYFTVINTSYFFIGTANLPYTTSLFLVPFSLLMLENALNSKEWKDYFAVVCTILVTIFFHIFTAFMVIGLVILRCFIHYTVYRQDLLGFILKTVSFIVPPLLISSFWFLPYISKPVEFSKDIGFVPSPINLLGLEESIIWGRGAGEIGVAFLLFIIFGLYTLLNLKKKMKEELLIYQFVSSALLLIMTFGLISILGLSPLGVDSTRYVPVLSIVAVCFCGLFIDKLDIKGKKSKNAFLAAILAILFVGMIQNYIVIWENTTAYKITWYESFLKIKENVLLGINETNYRFGTDEWWFFGEFLNYENPEQPQTFGYYDQGMLYPKFFYKMIDNIGKQENVNKTKFFVDWLGIKYFELLGDELNYSKIIFKEESLELVMKSSVDGIEYEIWGYKEPNPIISYVSTTVNSFETKNLEETIEELASKNINSKQLIPIFTDEKISFVQERYRIKDYNVSREIPDEIIINLKEEPEEGDLILVREFYDASWQAFEYPNGKNLKIYIAGPRFMTVFPSQSAERVVFRYGKSFVDFLGIFVSIIGLSILLYSKKYFL